MTRAIALSLLTVVVGGNYSEARAGFILSQYLGGLPGRSVSTSNAPFMTIIENADFDGFGVDTAGAFAGGLPIQFTDTDPFAYGIGAHPSSRIDFHLGAFRAIEGFDTFTAVIGIDLVDRGLNGATFTVLLDDVVVLRQDIADIDAGSMRISVPIAQQNTLSLATDYFDPVYGNHAAWADARLTSDTAVPEPSTFVLFSLGIVGMACTNRRSWGCRRRA